MPATHDSKSNGFGATEDGQQWPEIDSHFRLIIVAALRSKQLLRGASARIEADPLRRKNTSIALEEVKRGLVSFTLSASDQHDPYPVP